MSKYRTNNCGELRISDVGKTVKLAGWVQTIRNLGAMKFIDLRDEYGITQVVVSAEMDLKDIKCDKKKATEEDMKIAYDIDSIRRMEQIEKMRQAEQIKHENVERHRRML